MAVPVPLFAYHRTTHPRSNMKSLLAQKLGKHWNNIAFFLDRDKSMSKIHE